MIDDTTRLAAAGDRVVTLQCLLAAVDEAADPGFFPGGEAGRELLEVRLTAARQRHDAMRQRRRALAARDDNRQVVVSMRRVLRAHDAG